METDTHRWHPIPTKYLLSSSGRGLGRISKRMHPRNPRISDHYAYPTLFSFYVFLSLFRAKSWKKISFLQMKNKHEVE